MLPNVQRAKVESKSQPVRLPNVQRAKVESKSQKQARCYQMYKELKLKANHNKAPQLNVAGSDVTKCTKS